MLTNANHILSVGSIQIYSTNNIIELNDDISASVLYVCIASSMYNVRIFLQHILW